MSTPQQPAARAPLLGVILGSFVIAVLTVVFAISFAAVVYTGPMSAALVQGIAHTLAGGAVLAVAGMGVYAFKGTIAHPQDVTAILLGSAVAGVAAATLPQDLPGLAPTVGTLIILATLLGGIAAYASGVFRLDALVRFIPHPVIGGFLAATGYLLALGSVGMATKTSVDFYSLAPMFSADLLPKWAPWIASGLGLALLIRRIPNPLTLPIALTALFLGFYAALPLFGLSLSQAGEAGLLLGPFEDVSFLGALDPTMPLAADWGIIAAQTPTLLAVVLLVVIGSLLNSTGLEIALGRDFDLGRGLRATGITNIAASLAGGLPGYPAMGEPLLAQKLGLPGRVPAISACAGCAFALFFGADLLSLLPIGVFAALVAFLGFDLMLEWIWEMRLKLARSDYGVVLAIVAVAALFGFLTALVAGLIAAVTLFLVAYGRVEVIRARSTLAERRSRVERPLPALAALAETGGKSVVLELEGFLFFGTANKLRQAIKAELANAPDRILLDFRGVSGLDVSAVQALAKTASDLAQAGVPLIVASLPEAAKTQLLDACPLDARPVFDRSLDHALEAVEKDLLAQHPNADTSNAFAALIQALLPLAALSGPVQKINCGPEMCLIATGASSRELFLLQDGCLRAEVITQSGKRLRVARFLPGAIVGELAHYAGVPRTADILSETTAKLLRVDLDKLAKVDAALAGEVHLMVAQILARRLVNTTAVLRNAGL